MYIKEIKTSTGQKRYIAVEDGPKDPVTGKRRQIKRRGKTKKEAKKRVEEVIRELEESGIDQRTTKHLTFDAVAEEWLKMYELTGVKQSTIDTRKTALKALNNRMAKVPIGDISHLMYQKVINDIAVDNKENTVRGINATGNMVFKFAKKNKLIKDNPAEDVTLPRKRKTLQDVERDPIAEKYLDREELRAVLDAAVEHGKGIEKELIYTLAFSGMRVGELCALQKKDLDFDNRIIHIRKTIYSETQNRKKYELTTTKNEMIRDVEMEQPIMDLLKELVRKNDKHKMKYRLEEDYHDMDFVFQHPLGYPYMRSDVNYRIKKILQKAGFKRHITSHIFRHTHISMLTEANVDLPTIMQRVGHKDAKTTLEIYTHVTKKMKEEAADKLNISFGDFLQIIESHE